ncbi:MAG TPA: sulfatase [Longimicrobiales bacterium]
MHSYGDDDVEGAATLNRSAGGTPAVPVETASVPYFTAALAIGLAAGFGEVAFLGLQKLLLDRIVFMGRHAFWMIPLAEAFVCLGAALLLWIVARAVPSLRRFGLAVGVPAFLGALAVLLLLPSLHRLAAVLLALGVAVQAGRLASRGPRLSKRLAELGALALGVLLLVTVAATTLAPRLVRGGAAVEAPTNAPNILLLILDTVRASSLSVYGYSQPTTPHLEALGERGVVFENAIAPAPWTLPSHASMFTGISPARLSTDWRSPLDDTAPTLAEHLTARGYETAGFVANLGYCGWESGLQRGFSHYEDDPISVRQMVISSALVRAIATKTWFRDLAGTDENFVRKTADGINRDVLDWLSGREDEGRPFFAFLNYYDAHAPYMPPEPFRSRFPGAKERGAISPLHRWNSDPFGDPPADSIIAQEQAAYDAAIAYLDDRIGALIAELDRRGILANTIVVVTSDHGEEFGEHGLFDHGNSLYMPGLRVPLLVYHPASLAGRQRVGTTVSLTGLAAMLATLAGVAEGAPFPDRRLADAMTGAGTTATPALSEVTHATGLPEWFPVSRGNMLSLVAEQWHYIRNGDGTEELYDLGADPEERHDVSAAGESAAELTRLRSHAAAWIQERQASGVTP